MIYLSQTPYTLEQPAERRDGPRPGAYGGDVQAYLFGWKLWKALRRDAGLSPQELAVLQPGRDRALAERMASTMPGWTVEEIIDAMNGRRRYVGSDAVRGGLLAG